VTARRAADLGRLVLAVPGPITSDLSVGTHELIRDGAQIVESPQQLAMDLAAAQPNEQPQPEPARRPQPAQSPTIRKAEPDTAAPTTILTGLGPDEQIVLEALPTARCAGVQIPELSGATGIDPGIVFAGLGRLAALGLAAKNGSGWVLAPGREREARRYE
jgi:DNA processing protein